MNMKTERRKGERSKKGETKTAILCYAIQNWSYFYQTELRRYLNENYNIKDIKTVLTHLNQLKNKKYISIEKQNGQNIIKLNYKNLNKIIEEFPLTIKCIQQSNEALKYIQKQINIVNFSFFKDLALKSENFLKYVILKKNYIKQSFKLINKGLKDLINNNLSEEAKIIHVLYTNYLCLYQPNLIPYIYTFEIFDNFRFEFQPNLQNLCATILFYFNHLKIQLTYLNANYIILSKINKILAKEFLHKQILELTRKYEPISLEDLKNYLKNLDLTATKLNKQLITIIDKLIPKKTCFAK